MQTAAEIEKKLKRLGSAEKAKACAWYFKTGKGQYGYGDIFVGVTVPEQRKIAKEYKNLALTEIEKLLKNKIHECRLTALLILVEQYNPKGAPSGKRASEKMRSKLVRFYLAHTTYINNWDLVDLSAPNIVGDYL